MPDIDDNQEVIELSEDLQKVVLYAFDEAEAKLGGEEGLIPFTIVMSGENLAIDEHGGESAEECRESARKAVALDPASVDGYVFVYDGYIEPEDDPDNMLDAIILEFAEPDSEYATVLCKLYTDDGEGNFDVDEEIAIAGEVESFIPFEYRTTGDDDGGEDGEETEDADDATDGN
jgi:hypothetical protein